uniref:Uncharacterized protein n=1 Tax=Fagus sylvatica TaxID=28930 RepID=A0A2N9H5X6_FAGSY
MNRSSDERVMAPGSRGIGAVFVHFSGEDSDQTGDAFGEPRVPRRSWSRYLSNAPGLVDQLVASRKDSAREGGCPGGKNAFSSQRVFSQILSQFAHIFDLAPDVRFRRSWYRRKACAAYFCKVPDLRKSELGLEDSARKRVSVFLSNAPGLVDQLVASQEDSARKRGNVGGKFRKFQHSLISSACFHARGRRSSRCRISTNLGIVGKLGATYFSNEWSGSGQFDSAFGLVNSQVKPWSNLVNLGRIWSKLSKLWEMYPGPRFEGFWARWTLVRAGNGSVKPRSNFGQPWSNLVNPGQTLGNVSRTFSLGVFDDDQASLDHAGWVRVAPPCVPTPEKIPWVKMGL